MGDRVRLGFQTGESYQPECKGEAFGLRYARAIIARWIVA
jgi:hypothetical protein